MDVIFGSFQDEGFKINFKHFPSSQFKIQKSEHLKLLLTMTLEQVFILQGWNLKPSRWSYEGSSKAQQRVQILKKLIVLLLSTVSSCMVSHSNSGPN